jgi:PAS domain S-box-containing protein
VRLKELTKTKGFKDYGFVGQMREIIHEVEDKVKAKNDLRSNIYLLTLRRHEKDYLLRKDLRYKERFENTNREFISFLSGNKHDYQTAELINALHRYGQIFNKVIEKDIELGLEEESGLLHSLNQISQRIETDLNVLHDAILSTSKNRTNLLIIYFFAALTVLSLIVLLILRRISKEIVTSITKLKNHVAKLGRGELPDNIKIRYHNEISKIIKNINVLTDNLKNTREFAIEVGQGNLETNINVFNNEGDLGGALIQMRNQLKEVSKERQFQQEKDRIQIWLNDGIAKMSSIMREFNDHLDDLSYHFIKTLVKYMKANQAGIFLVTESEGETVYELVAAYAYDRRKFLEKRVKPGEGLVGTCALEKEYIYLTEIPEKYINITSGLGDANPNCLALMPLKKEEDVLGVIEIASFNCFEEHELNFLQTIAESFAVTISTVRNKEQTEKLLKQSKIQAEELQSQEEELRQNLEELVATQEDMARKEKQLKSEIQELKKDKQENNQVLLKELKRLKKLRKESTIILDSLNSSILIGELSIHGEFISVNRKFVETLGYSEAELEGKLMSSYMPAEDVNEYEKMWKSIVEGETQERISKRITKDGESIWLKTTYSPVKEDKGYVEKVFFIAKTLTGQDVNPEEFKDKDELINAKKELESNLKFFVELQNKWPDKGKRVQLS